jgi:dipeptidyl aminopeptidase/acylaminoacyl peptidase
MNTPRTILTDALLKDELSRRADGPNVSAELLDEVLWVIQSTTQRGGWSLRLARVGRPDGITSPLGRASSAWPLLILIATVATVVLAGTILTAGAREKKVLSPTDLGVFEPARGRVVFLVGSDTSHLEAVDPADPSSSIVIDADLGRGDLMPAGWSADGSKLALTDEVLGDLYVMDQTGSLDRVGPPHVLGDCPCRFITPAWMSPDGRERLPFFSNSGWLRVFDVDDNHITRTVDVRQFEGFALAAWSPDGSQVAFMSGKNIGIVDLASGASREVDVAIGAGRELFSGWGIERHLSWSPNGAQILVVAVHDDPFPVPAGFWNGYANPLQGPLAASLYLVDVDDGAVHEIASGHYVAAAWSPDGTQIAAVDYPGSHEVVVLNADGSGRRVLASLPVGDYFTGVVWHPLPAR